MSTPTHLGSVNVLRPASSDSGTRSTSKQSIPPLPVVALPSNSVSRVSSNSSSVNRTPLIPPLPTPPMPKFDITIKPKPDDDDDSMSAYSSDDDDDDGAQTTRIRYKSNPTSGLHSLRDLSKAQNESNNDALSNTNNNMVNSNNNSSKGGYTVDIKVRSKTTLDYTLEPTMSNHNNSTISPLPTPTATATATTKSTTITNKPIENPNTLKYNNYILNNPIPENAILTNTPVTTDPITKKPVLDVSNMLFSPQNRMESSTDSCDWSTFQPGSAATTNVHTPTGSASSSMNQPVDFEETWVHPNLCNNLISTSAVSVAGLSELVLEPSLQVDEDGKYHFELYRLLCTKEFIHSNDMNVLCKSDGKPPSMDAWQNISQAYKYKHGVCVSSIGTLTKTKEGGMTVKQAISGAIPFHYIATDDQGVECTVDTAEYIWQRIYLQVLPSKQNDNYNAPHNLTASLTVASDRVHLPLVRVPLRQLQNHQDMPILMTIRNTQSRSFFKSDTYKTLGSTITSSRRLLDWPAVPSIPEKGNAWTPIAIAMPQACAECSKLQLHCPRALALLATTPQKPVLPFITQPDLQHTASQVYKLNKNNATLFCKATLTTVLHPSTTHVSLYREEFDRLTSLAKKYNKTLGTCMNGFLPSRFIEHKTQDVYMKGIESLPRPDCFMSYDIRCNLPSCLMKTVVSVSCLTKGNHILANLFNGSGKPSSVSSDLFGSTMNEQGTSKGGDNLTTDYLASRRAFRAQGYDIYSPQNQAEFRVAGFPSKYKGRANNIELDSQTTNIHIQSRAVDTGALLRQAEREWRLVALSGAAREGSPNHAPKFGTMQTNMDLLSSNKLRRAILFAVHNQQTGQVLAYSVTSPYQLFKLLLKTPLKTNQLELPLTTPDNKTIGSVFISDVALHTPVDCLLNK